MRVRLVLRCCVGPLGGYLMEISSLLYSKRDDAPGKGAGLLVDAILDSCGSKGTGKWTVQQAAELGVPCATMAAALEARCSRDAAEMQPRCSRDWGGRRAGGGRCASAAVSLSRR